MLDSVIELFNHYLSVGERDIDRFDIHSLATHRGSEPTDVYYLCNVRGLWYLIFETDRFDSLYSIQLEARDIFESSNFELSHWIGPKRISRAAYTLSLDAPENTLERMGMKYVSKESGLNYVMIFVEYLNDRELKVNP